MLNDILNTFGLGAAESNVYAALLKSGPVTAGALAKRVGLPRPSVYGFLKGLHNVGLVTQTQKDGVKRFVPETPEKIGLLFQQRIEELESRQKQFQKLLPSLSTEHLLKYVSPKFQLFEGEEGVQHVLKDMLLYNDLETQAFWPIKAMVDILSPDFFRYHNKRRIRNNLYTRAIWPKNQTVDIKTHPYLGVGKAFCREIRLAPKNVDFTMGYWIYGNKTAFISSRAECFGFIIESAELAETLRAQFELVWNASVPLKVNAKESEAFLKELEATHR